MKTIRKISTIVLAGIMAMALFVLPAHAVGQGEVQFSDPQAKSGEEFKVTAKMTCGGQLIGDGKLVLKYDPECLEFVEGTGSRDATSGAVTIFNAGTGTETELDYTITFKALKEGETEITVTDSEAYLWNNQTLNLTLGSSKVTVAKGDGSSDSNTDTDSKSKVKGTGPTVTIGNKQYKIVNDIPPVEIPQGFNKAKISFNNKDVNAIKQDASGQQALYMTDGSEETMFLYNDEDGSFAPFELIDISEEAYIILLQDSDTPDVPRGFDKVTLKYNDSDFPAWQNPGHEDYYLVYALNSAGDKELYLYDNKEQTFQRFVPEILNEKKAPGKKRNGWEGTILDFIEDHLKPCLIAMAILLFFMLILVLILGLKVRNRNIEIDDLYDELDGKKPVVPAAPPKNNKKAAKKASKKAKKSKKSKTSKSGRSPYDNGYDYDDDFPMEEELFSDDAFDAYEYDNYDNGFNFDDDEILENPTGHLPQKLTDTLADHRPIDSDVAPRRPSRSQTNQKFHVDNDDTFKLDFIDLDD